MSSTSPKTRTPRQAHRRAVTATVVGNFVESFDWLGYGLFAQHPWPPASSPPATRSPP
ncbi:hypothetical protein [Streptomyces sp. ADI95-16]|uniref:hypothetical protein n=1 Tax=Streptomyces sp. ADI95-16 TaxID=1522758 RepID=UPI0020B3728C|nr:hypothetical protein [Streptomyces sp. ADI95-16]